MALPTQFSSLLIHPTSPLASTTVTLPLPDPSSLPPAHVLIRVHVTASNPKDYLHLIRPFNSGDDFAGIVVYATPDVTHLKPGDRVAAFHQMQTDYGAYAEYAIAPAWTTFKMPDSMSWEEASTIPLVSATAAVTLFRRQGLAAPWEEGAKERNKGKVLLVYGVSGALGCFCVKLAKLAGVKGVIAVGGGSSDYLRGSLGEDNVYVDYRLGWEEVTKQVREAVKERGWDVRYGVDCVSQDGSWVHISQMMDGGVLSVVNGKNRYDEEGIRPDVEISYTFVGTVHMGEYLEHMPKQPAEQEVEGDIEFARHFFTWLEEATKQGMMKGHPYQVIEGGLDGVVTGLNMLRDGEAKGKKIVYQINRE